MSITRLGAYGGPRQVYGAFDPKAEGVPTPVAVARRGGWLPPEILRRLRKRAQEEPDWKARDKEAAELAEVVEAAYNAAMGIVPPEQKPDVAEIVAPFVTTRNKPRKSLPRAQRVDWTRLARDLDAAEELLRMLQRIRDDEDTIEVLLLAA